jgi:glycosyltransferase involved in cell wall biosynthesis
MLDVLIQTHNEEENLPHALTSLAGWVNKIFVVDSGSTDSTLEIARAGGAVVIHHDWEGYAGQKNWALANLPWESDWILILDADESVTAPLKAELMRVSAHPAADVPESGFYINRMFVFMGRKIRHCGYYPSWNLRLFKRGKARYENRRVHEHMIVDGPATYLKGLLMHEDRRGIEHFIAKHNRYSTLEAQELYATRTPWPGLAKMLRDRMVRRRFLKTRILPELPVPWLWKFLYMYLWHEGFLDRAAGWNLCVFIGSYEYFISVKFKELRRLDRAGRRLPGGSVGSGLAVGEGSVNEAEALRRRPANVGAS